MQIENRIKRESQLAIYPNFTDVKHDLSKNDKNLLTVNLPDDIVQLHRKYQIIKL